MSRLPAALAELAALACAVAVFVAVAQEAPIDPPAAAASSAPLPR